MLETRNLKKVYRTKKGVSVNALNGVSVKFPEKGLVFLLGKSGSGKSTLLNLLGGLDRYDEGEIIIKGVSSKEFKQGHFDSYRNTYVGFIFQEYNILEEFTVGANIALAIELQNRKASDVEINSILKQVDLEGFGDRKPNELSGGQKQRVAIARALVKEPQIIMADEPTGALDSNTGRQVFETLKKLSKDKLVIVVSHDRDFAQKFGDRIIELADGNIIDDVTRTSGYRDNNIESGITGDVPRTDKYYNNETEGIIIDDVTCTNKYYADESDGITFDDNTMLIKSGYHLTEDDRRMINEYLEKLDNDLTCKVVKQTKISFEKTDERKINYSDSEFKLIKSKLPLKNAFKIGASGLKYKKIRMAVTILLSFIAFTLFALADTMGNYNHIKTCTNSIKDSEIAYASVAKSLMYGEGVHSYWSEYGNYLSSDEIKKLNKDTDYDFVGVVRPDIDLEIYNYDKNVKLSESDMICYATDFSGFTALTGENLKKMGYKLVAGNLPSDNGNEIAISEYVYETFAKAGYSMSSSDKDKMEIKYYSDLVGKKLFINDKEYTIAGIVDTKMDMNRYASISESTKGKSSAQIIADFALSNELDQIKQYSLSCTVFVSEVELKKIMDDNPGYVGLTSCYMFVSDENTNIDSSRLAKLSEINLDDVTWVNEKKDTLNRDEIIIDANSFISYTDKGEIKEFSSEELLKYLKEHKYTLNYYIDEKDGSVENVKVVGVLNLEKVQKKNSDVYVVSDEIYNMDWSRGKGEYAYAVTSMPTDKNDIESLVKYCYADNAGMRYQMKNSVAYELDSINEILQILSKLFLYIGIGFAVFAMVMLSNFIATSISYKKQDIGILRAIGARSHDVFRIFFSESFIIAMTNFILAVVATGVITAAINEVFRKEVGILITILNFGPRQILLLLLISLVVASVASFVPVYKIASKRPIEAIRNR